MNARYYLPGIGRFASADTIVPNPADPQSFNRYSYAFNNPLRFRDPTGHCPVGDTACWALADELYTQFGWYLAGLDSNGRWTLNELQILWDAARAIEAWFAQHGGGDAHGRMRAALGGTQFTKAGIVGNLVLEGNHHVRGNKVHLRPGFTLDNVIHEIGHVLDNNEGIDPYMTAVFGGGPADAMSRKLGFNPAIYCPLNRSRCSAYATTPLREPIPTHYGTYGSSEDFGDTFMLSVTSPTALGPIRAQFMADLARSFITNQGEFQGSPYTVLQRTGQGYIGFGGGNSTTSSHLLH